MPLKLSWKSIVGLAVVLTLVITTLDFYNASKGDQDLYQYEVESITPDLGEGVLDHLSRTAERLKVYSEDIGNVPPDEE